MKVGVLGSGDVAKVLASGFLKHGHEVKMGSGTVSKLAGNSGIVTTCSANSAPRRVASGSMPSYFSRCRRVLSVPW